MNKVAFNGQVQMLPTVIVGDARDKLDTIADATCALAITSPPYNIGKEYEKGQKRDIAAYMKWIAPILERLARKLTSDGHMCLQVGTHVSNGEIFPLDFYFFGVGRDLGLKLRNRIIWRYNFGLNAQRRFSGRYETLLWFSKSDDYKFNLDPVRIPQIYPGKRHASSRGPKAGTPSGNPLGKNPSDYWEFSPAQHFLDDPVWEIPNVKANHPEKTTHPAQFPVELIERCVLALTTPGDIVIDPFLGSGTSVIAAIKHSRIGLGIELNPDYARMARSRIDAFAAGELRIRDIGTPIQRPRQGSSVSRVPKEWLGRNEDADERGA